MNKYINATLLLSQLGLTLLVSTFPLLRESIHQSQMWHIKMLIRYNEYCRGEPWAGHNKRPLANVRFYIYVRIFFGGWFRKPVSNHTSP